MRANAQKTWCLLAAATALLTGCSVLVESDKKQCTKHSQCATPYVCGKAGLCEIETGCATKADCREGGVCLEGKCKLPECKDSGDDCDRGELCNTELGACVRESLASCAETKDCVPYEGAQVCIKSEQLCGGAECKEAADCTDESPTAMCNGGACDDPTWGCLGVPDPRETPDTSEEASFKVKVLYGFAQGGAKETGVKDLNVRVCQFGDVLCSTPVGEWTYGADNNLVITGLESGLYYKIQLRANSPATAGTELYPTEYLMYRTVVEETEDPKPILMYEEKTFDQTAVIAEVERDPDLGMLLMRIFDCTDTEVAGVTVSPDKSTTGCSVEAPCETTVFYQNTGNIPDPGASATNTAGRAGILNLKPGVNNRITLTRVADAKKITAFVVTPQAGWLTYVFFWPWDYGTAAD